MFEKFCGDALSDYLWIEFKKEAFTGILKKYFNFSILLILDFLS